MAGDWIKMRTSLSDDPAVISIAEVTGLDEDHVVGKLHRIWSWFDRQTLDGNAAGVSVAWLSRYLNHEGFAEAMVLTGWLVVDGNGICIPNFDRHNGESAKKRMLTAKRVCKHKQKGNAVSVTKALPREEKKTEEKKKKSVKAVKRSSLPLQFPDGFDTPKCRESVERWFTYRCELGKPYRTQDSKQSLLNKWAKVGPARFIAAVNFSIAQGYQGIFEENYHHGRSQNAVRTSGPGQRFDPNFTGGGDI